MKRITLTGNLGKDPELKLDSSGLHFATFSVAVNVGNKQKPKIDWVDVSCNGKLAEIVCTYAKKGVKVLVEGYPYTNAYINKDNIPVATIKVFANIVEILNKIENNLDDEIPPSNNFNELVIDENCF